MAKMAKALTCLVTLFFILFMVQRCQGRNELITEVFRSPKIDIEPGQVSNKVYLDMDFPKGHIAVKNFHAEVVDDKGNSVPLYEVYLHHWLVVRFYTEINNQSNFIIVPDSGVCGPNSGLANYFGSGAETRRTRADIPDPYGIVVGNPADVPKGFQEMWLLNVHVIDTRGAVDTLGCIECTCDFYSNITLDEPLPKNYGGGLLCCTDGARCKVKDDFKGGARTIFLKYTITYVDWDATVIPLKIYNLDSTDLWTKANPLHNCQIEYDVQACGRKNGSSCIDSKSVTFDFKDKVDVIYGVGHQHIGGLSIGLYGKGGKEICISQPKYGTGKKPGNEAGYVVGMSTCYPQPGSVKISPGEMITLVSNYSSTVRHTGVMGLFYLLVVDSSP